MFLSNELNAANSNLSVAKSRYEQIIPEIENGCNERLHLLAKIALESFPKAQALMNKFNLLIEQKEESVKKYEWGKLFKRVKDSVSQMDNAVNKLKNDLGRIGSEYSVQGGNFQYTCNDIGTAVLAGSLGVSVGVGIAVYGPTGLMAAATTFGTTATGVEISSLSGIAATNAAKAWLGGGSLAAGGGGMAAGEALLTAMNPVGWMVAIGAVLAAGVWMQRNKMKDSIGNIDAATKRINSIVDGLIKKHEMILMDHRFASNINTNLVVNLDHLCIMIARGVIDNQVVSDIDKACTQINSLAAYIDKRMTFNS